jgi:hypothetical protein
MMGGVADKKRQCVTVITHVSRRPWQEYRAGDLLAMDAR